MDFFAQQLSARRYTSHLVLLLLVAVIAVTTVTDLLVTLGAALIFDRHDLPWLFHQLLVGTLLLAILIAARWRQHQLRGGGDSIAKMVKARQIMPDTINIDERRLLNVVDEMSIASGVTAPTVWVMDKEPGINAFAAGVSANQAIIVVTQGMLTQFNRDELQGIIGHEFSHILNGDMLLNVRLISVLAGISVIGRAGMVGIGLVIAIPATLYGVISFLGSKVNDLIFRMGWRTIFLLPLMPVLFLLPLGLLYVIIIVEEMQVKPLVMFGALIIAVGYAGVFSGRIIRAAVSRQREFLADASSVQFTRNPDGLVSALERIRHSKGSVIDNAYADEMSHMFFSQAISPKIFKGWFATHPLIEDRIENITGHKPETLQKTVAIAGKSRVRHYQHHNRRQK